MAHKRIGEILVESGVVKPAAVDQALATQQSEGGLLGELLIKGHACTEDDVLRALGAQLGIAFLADFPVVEMDAELAAKVPIGFAKQHRVMPLKREGDAVLVATADPLDVGAIDDVRAMLGEAVTPVLLPGGKLLEAINHVYGRKQDAGNLGQGENEDDEGAAEELVDILDVNDEAPIIRWVNALHVQRGQGAGQRHPHRAGREGRHRPLPHRRRALRDPAGRAPVHPVHHLAREDHGRAEHRGEAPAAGRPHPPQDRRQGHRHARRHRADGQGRRAHHHPSARPRDRAPRPGRHRLRRGPPDGR